MHAGLSPAIPRAASLDRSARAGRLVVHPDGHSVCLIADGDAVHAVDNRCPHMGFPLLGHVSDGILTCHWHHARFDLCSADLDQWADDLRRFPVEMRGDDVLVDPRPPADRSRISAGGCRSGWNATSRWSLAKATIALAASDPSGADAFRAGLEFGVERRGDGWGRGLTTLVCLTNLPPWLEGEERAAALYHGLADVAADRRRAAAVSA